MSCESESALGDVATGGFVNRPNQPDRLRFTRAYLALYEEVGTILDRHDPVGLITSGSPKEEYKAEVSTILPRLRLAADPKDALRIVNEEFERWFDRPASDSEELGLEVWAAWQRYLAVADSRRVSAD
jgi:hypothetical protein